VARNRLSTGSIGRGLFWFNTVPERYRVEQSHRFQGTDSKGTEPEMDLFRRTCVLRV